MGKESAGWPSARWRELVKWRRCAHQAMGIAHVQMLSTDILPADFRPILGSVAPHISGTPCACLLGISEFAERCLQRSIRTCFPWFGRRPAASYAWFCPLDHPTDIQIQLSSQCCSTSSAWAPTFIEYIFRSDVYNNGTSLPT